MPLMDLAAHRETKQAGQSDHQDRQTARLWHAEYHQPGFAKLTGQGSKVVVPASATKTSPLNGLTNP